MSFKISAIDHVQLTIPPGEEAAARCFYRDVLGLEEIEKPAGLKERGGFWFRLSNAQLHIAVDPGATGSGSKRHVCLIADDLDAARSVLKERGITIIDEPITADGLERFFVRDPADNRVEIGRRIR